MAAFSRVSAEPAVAAKRPVRHAPAAKRPAAPSALHIGAANDAFEREADRLADAVMSPRSTALHHGVTQGPIALRRACACGSGASEGACESCQAGVLQRKAASGARARTAPPLVHEVLSQPGRSMEGTTRRFMEASFGHSFGDVRIHADAAAAASARQVGGLAYTVGQRIVFDAGRYAPGTPRGDRLLAHELAHTLQQRRVAPRLQRACREGDECDTGVKSTPAAPAAERGQEAFMQPGWSDVSELGIVYQEKASLFDEPGGQVTDTLAHDIKVMILKENIAQKWYAVMRADTGQFGYIDSRRLLRNLPDPDSRVVKVKAGDTALGIARAGYPGRFDNAWKADKRYVVNALVWVNEHAKHNFAGAPVIEKKDTVISAGGLGDVKLEGKEDAPWQTVQVKPGYMWLPGEAYLLAVMEDVIKKGGGTGSIKADVLRKIEGAYYYIRYALAFIAGVVHGFLKSLWDALAGIASMLYDIGKSLITGRLISDVKALAGSIQKLKWDDIKDAIGKWADEWATKLESESPWVAGHAHGYLTGYVMAEAAMLLLSGGALTELKGAMWGSKLGEIIKGSEALKTIEGTLGKLAEARKLAGGKVDEALIALRKSRAGKAVKVVETGVKAVRWTAATIGAALSLPQDVAVWVVEKMVEHAKELEPFFARIKSLTDRAKRWLFGCRSPCKWDADAVRKTMTRLGNDEIEAQAAAELAAGAQAARAAEDVKAAKAAKAPLPEAQQSPTATKARRKETPPVAEREPVKQPGKTQHDGPPPVAAADPVATAKRNLKGLQDQRAELERQLKALQKKRQDLNADYNRAVNAKREAAEAQLRATTADGKQAAGERAKAALTDQEKARKDLDKLASDEDLHRALRENQASIGVESIKADSSSRAALVCFAADTTVHTPQGPRPIQMLDAGDIVLAWDFASAQTVERRVTQLHRGRTRHWVDAANASGRVRATRAHRFFDAGAHEWIEAMSLRAGSRLLRPDGGTDVIEAMTTVDADEAGHAETYNLSVEGASNYFVGPGWLVHNVAVDIGLGGHYVIYRATNPKYPGVVYVGQTTDLDAAGKPRGAAVREVEHQKKAVKALKADADGLEALSKADREFYEFMQEAKLDPVVKGIATQAQADYLEQLNMNIEHADPSVKLKNRRNQITSEAHMKEVVAEIRNDPAVKAKGYCP